MSNLSYNTLIRLYEIMMRIRLFEEKVVASYPKQEMKTPVHLYIGEEAVAAGVCAALRSEDYVFGTHRSHGIYIAKGGSLPRLAAELYGKKTGCSKGKGGSMHVVDVKRGVCGTTAIVGGNIPLAVGAALGAAIRKDKSVACVFFGDGAVDEGVFYESMNFAALKKLPVIFVCENNFYATHSHVSKRQPLDNIYERGYIFGINGIRVDGNDALCVYAAAIDAVSNARDGKGPALIECRTYRWKTHVGPENDADLGMPAGKDLHIWMKNCPVKKMRRYIENSGQKGKRDIERVNNKIQKEINAAFLYARRSPFPAAKELYCDVDESAKS